MHDKTGIRHLAKEVNIINIKNVKSVAQTKHKKGCEL